MSKEQNMSRPVFAKLLSNVIVPASIVFTAMCCNNSGERILQDKINKVSAKWAPDHRVALCTASLKTTGKQVILTGETTIPEAKADIIKTLDSLNIDLIDSLLILPDTSRNPKYLGVVSLSVINLRKEPDHSSEMVSQAILGTPVVILKNSGSWVLIQTPDSYISWTEESSLKALSKAGMNRWQKSTRVIYMENTGWLHDTTTSDAGIVSDLVGGNIIETTGETKDYLKVELPDGRKGFVEKLKVSDFDSWRSLVQCTGESICKTAMTYMGIPYLWGGTSPKGADCSGFVQSVFFRNGLILQRDASLQALYGSPVDLSGGYEHLNRGDLLFFGTNNKSVPHVTHVAIYLGNKDYINASGKVMINSLDPANDNFSNHRLSSLLFARRVINIEGNLGTVPIKKNVLY